MNLFMGGMGSPVMYVLAIETSTLTGSVALLEDEKVIGEMTLSISVQHSERLMPAVEQLMTISGIDLKKVDLFAVATGPGSFTGLRIGIAAAQGLSLATDKPIIGVSTLEGLACNASYFSGMVVPILNAFRSEVYRGLYRVDTGIPESLEEDRAMGIDSLIEEIQKKEEKVLLLGNGLDVYAEALTKALGTNLNIIQAHPVFWNPRASAIAFLALKKWKQGVPKEAVLPRYLRIPG